MIERVPCAGDAGQSYALYLPSTYSRDRAWPILYAFDPGGQGARPVKLAAGPAERFGWIVAGSNNSRNGPMPEIQAAVAAIVNDTGLRFAIDARRVYATGFSGGARVATGLAMGCRGCVAGVFAQGAGLPAGAANADALDAAWFAAAGERDMNYAELFQLEQELLKRGARERFRVFAGGHEWAPAPVWDEALAWFELLAMKDGRRPRDATLVASLFEGASARAAGFRDRGELLDERRELEAVVRDFDGAADTAAARGRLKELAASSDYRKALDRQRSAIAEQARVTAELGNALLKLAEPPGEGRAEVVLRANRDAHELTRNLASAKDADRRLVYERALSQVYIQAMETARGALRQERRTRLSTCSRSPLRCGRKRRSRSSAARRPRPRPGASRTPSGRCAVRSSSAFRRRTSRASSTPTTRSRSCAPTPTFARCSRRQPVPRTRADDEPRF